MLRATSAMVGLLPSLVGAVEFQEPVRMMAGDEVIRTEAPGYACPTWADIDRDGKMDLLVGQYRKGKIKIHRNLGGDGVPKLSAGEWLQAEGKPAEVPGVW